jgi:CheY-like chemotaxis protein
VPRILVADDNSNIQKMVALAFQDRGIEVTSVGNGEAAVRRLAELNPDLILADIFMPVRNGYEVCEWVKKDTKFSHIPVILLVGAFDPLDEKEARRVGADGVLKKPFIPPDPLIAMVTAVLEKGANEKVSKASAEPGTAKETASAPQPSPIAVEIPAKIEAKAIPEFPEPSPEEASLAYGFGSGRRTLDDEGPGEGAEPPAPIAAIDKEAEEEFEGASTTKDWRRSAMEFEIPEETSRRPAFSSEGDLNPAFPSEKDVPAKHVRTASAVEEVEEIETVVPEALELDDRAVPVTEAAGSSGVAETAVAAPQISASESSTLEASLTSAQAGEPERPVVVEPSFASKAAHWMDLMASPAEQTRGDWFSSTFGSRAQTGKQETPGAPVASSSTVLMDAPHEIVTEAAPPAEEPFFADESETSEPAFDAASALHAESTVIEDAAIKSRVPERDQVTAPAEVAAEVHAETPVQVEESHTPEIHIPTIPEIDEHIHEQIAGEIDQHMGEQISEHFSEQIDAVIADRSAELAAEHAAEHAASHIEEHSGDFAEELSDTPAPEAGVQSDVTNELESEVADEPTLAKEADLVEPPAVHVTPEPLLVDETPRGGSTYAAREQETAPLYSFLSAAPQNPAAPHTTEESAAERPADESFAEIPSTSVPEMAAGTITASAQAEELPLEANEKKENRARALEFSSLAFDAPVQTPSVPIREAVAHIPFLNPPPEFRQADLSSAAEGHEASESAGPSVDAVVQKVLERLEPQIRELLSQNVLKPLVESLLKNDIEKKNH